MVINKFWNFLNNFQDQLVKYLLDRIAKFTNPAEEICPDIQK